MSVRLPAARAAAFALLALAAGGSRARAGGEGSDPAGDLRRAASPAMTTDERAMLLHRVAESGEVPDADAMARLATRLLLDSAGTGSGFDAVRLLHRALEAGGVSAETRALARSAVEGFTGEPSGEPPKVDVAGFAILAGVRPEPYRLLSKVSATPAAREAIAFDAPEMAVPAGSEPIVRDASWARHVAAADRMDAALEDDPAVSRPALDALLASKDEAMPYLLALAAHRKGGGPKGIVPRRARAILVLGMAGDRRATPALASCLADDVEDHEDGWVRVAAATALGDLGDKAAVVPLARVLFYLGDVHRTRDVWDYPGRGETDVPEEAWADVEYQAVDEAAADALLRLGVGNAAEWLVRERLAISVNRWRIRVLQDASDGVRRAFPKAPPYEADAGIPDRDRAARALLAWWGTGPRLDHPLDAADPSFAPTAAALVARLGQKSVMELQIARQTAALLGPAIVPALLAALPAAKGKVFRAEVAAALGGVRDRRAVAPLLGLLGDPAANVRAVAAEALAAYLGEEGDPVFAGEAAVEAGEIARRLAALLDDEEEGPRAAALRALAASRPSKDVLQALAAHASASHPENAFADFVLAEDVVRLVQTGEGLERLAPRLVDPSVYQRRTAWELLVRALRVEPASFDPTPDPVPIAPGRPKAKPVDLEALRAALAKRRAP